MAPEQYSRFPTDTHVPDVVVAAAPPALVDSLVHALGAGTPCPPALASAVAVLGTYGALPEDPGPLAAAARAAGAKVALRAR